MYGRKSCDPPVNRYHPINIFVYKNGEDKQPPTLVHLSTESKKTLKSTKQAIHERLKWTVGYVDRLYHVDGTRVRSVGDLRMYGEYVAVSNLDTQFKCADYGDVKDPLIAFGPHSKHIRSINIQGLNNYNIFCIMRRKTEDKRMKYAYLYNDATDGMRSQNLLRVTKMDCEGQDQDKPFQDLNVYPPPPPLNHCWANFDPITTDNSGWKRRNRGCHVQTDGAEDGINGNGKRDIAVGTGEPPERQQSVTAVNGEPESRVNSEHLLAFINRYRDVGGQLYQMFYDKLTNGQRSALEPKTEDKKWYSDHLFNMFLDRLDAKENTGAAEERREEVESSNFKGSSIDFDNISDTMTGANPGSSNLVPKDAEAYDDQRGPARSLSNLVRDGSLYMTGTGLASPRDRKEPSRGSNRYATYTALIDHSNQDHSDLYYRQIPKCYPPESPKMEELFEFEDDNNNNVELMTELEEELPSEASTVESSSSLTQGRINYAEAIRRAEEEANAYVLSRQQNFDHSDSDSISEEDIGPTTAGVWPPRDYTPGVNARSQNVYRVSNHQDSFPDMTPQNAYHDHHHLQEDLFHSGESRLEDTDLYYYPFGGKTPPASGTPQTRNIMTSHGLSGTSAGYRGNINVVQGRSFLGGERRGQSGPSYSAPLRQPDGAHLTPNYDTQGRFLHYVFR